MSNIERVQALVHSAKGSYKNGAHCNSTDAYMHSETHLEVNDLAEIQALDSIFHLEV